MHESVKLLEQRCHASPACIRGLPMTSLEIARILLRQATMTLVTGLGASEGPARLLASCLSTYQRAARFMPLSGLVAGDHAEWTAGERGTVLVIFSQSLSPNARMALDAGRDFSATILVCGADVRVDDAIRSASGMNLHVIQHPPDQETGFLMRVTGPAVASAVALGLAALTTTDENSLETREQLMICADAMEMRIYTRPPDANFIESPPAFLVYGNDGIERNQLLRWSMLECFEKYVPPMWDLFSFAHGAFQNIFDSPRTLIMVRSLEDPSITGLLDRLREMLRKTRHTLIDVPSELPRPWCVLEHLAMVQAFMLEHLRRNPRDLRTWPGQGHDGPLYLLRQMP